MAARAYWQGQIRLALVSIPVEVYSATRSGAKISFRQIHEASGQPISYEKVAPGVGPVDKDDIISGYEVSKGNFILLEDREIEAVKVESKRTLELVQFVDAAEIDPLYFEKPYYVAPTDDLAEEAFVVLREAMRKANKIGLGQLSVRGQEKLVALKPCGKGMLLETLRYADEVRKGQAFFADIGADKPDKSLLYVDALRRLIEQKSKSKSKKAIIEEPDEPSGKRGNNVVDLMAALKKSLGDEKKPAAPRKPAAAKKPAARKRA